ncbi:MAG: hypothetical protein H7288_15465 [Kineosporiaceae bacterium]|nr:hypothetical protein [Aeromicrobium sp.]
MQILHRVLRVTDIDASLAFSGAIGYRVVSRVLRAAIGDLTLLNLPDDEFVAMAGRVTPTGSPDPRRRG